MKFEHKEEINQIFQNRLIDENIHIHFDGQVECTKYVESDINSKTIINAL